MKKRNKRQKFTEKVLFRLQELQNKNDIEYTHLEADKILCELLIELGYKRIVDEYAKIPKWYA